LRRITHFVVLRIQAGRACARVRQKMKASAMPAVTTTAGMETTATETAVETTARETAVETTARETTLKAPAMETPVETTMMKGMMMKESKPEPYGNAVAVIRQ